MKQEKGILYINEYFYFQVQLRLKSWCEEGRSELMLQTGVKLMYALCTSKTPTVNSSLLSFNKKIPVAAYRN